MSEKKSVDDVPLWQREPAPSNTDEDALIESKERVLSEMVIAILVQFARIANALEHRLPSDGDLTEITARIGDVTRVLHRHIGKLNATWLSRKRSDRLGALAEARQSLCRVGQVSAISQFLELGLGTAILRGPCVQIAGLLEIPLGPNDRR